MSLPLYRRVLGPRFLVLPRRVRELHELTSASQWAGEAKVERGRSRLSRLAAWIAGLPPDGRDQPLRVTFEPVGANEIWTRQFGEAQFRSVQSERSGLLCERAGPTTFVFTPVASGDGLALRLDGFRLFGLPLPRLVHPSVRTWECERDGRYQFEVEARLPLAGLIVRYGGWLVRQG
ncbi:MAG TPA: DUF4166 domain-containing protein [Hyphomicrobiaceae bacterium]|jgi:hypothetical protein|nr:DUF4166 domain-containing protein [Hyphomicrobiaceae bacterium]